jgi:NAD(P)-dependent dehydrogenase (short-subunit alcohol dehydrogenase family)
MLNPLDMAGRTILVTGASSGIGRETAILLSQLGGRIVLVGRDRPKLEATHSSLEGSGHRVEPQDLCALDDIPDWLKRVTSETGPLSGLAHCAGLQFTLPVHQVTAAQVGKIMEINLTAAIMLAKGLRQKTVHATTGSLVLVSSIMGLVGAVGLSVYSSTKSALIGLSKSLALELAQDGLRVNCVAPGFVDTAMFQSMKNLLGADQIAAIESAHPLGIGQPRDVAHAIAFLLADTGRWITGSTLVVDGGYTTK